MKRQQPALFEEPAPVEQGNPLFCHEEFLEELARHGEDRIGKRTAYLLYRLVLDESRLPFKATQGVNRGWRRSRLGGNAGSHFYAWWAPKGAPPLRGKPGFKEAPPNSIFLRSIRHHDDHAELSPQSTDQYLPLTPRDLRRQDYAPSPLTAAQAKFAHSRGRVRVLRGFPGSGKTTALWEATEASCVGSALYVTYSKELAALAAAYFRRIAPGNKQFRVVTFSQLVREIAGVDPPEESERDRRRRFRQHIGGFSPRILGPWIEDRASLYDEVHAHLIGSAVPEQAGRFVRCERPRVPDRAYRESRRSFIGGAAADAAMESLSSLEKREGGAFFERFFPELLLAWKAAAALSRNAGQFADRFGDLDCIAIDEVQDLTPLEAFVIAKLTGVARRGGCVLASGDEGQTVRPTDFEWGWFNDLVYSLVTTPADFSLTANLRSPRRIAGVVNRLSALYAHVAKQDRPGGAATAEVEDDAGDLLMYCAAAPGPALDDLLATLTGQESVAVICLDDQVPGYVPEPIRHKVLTIFEAKGLDFKSVCVLDPGRHLARILHNDDRIRRDAGVIPLNRRLAIDELRVAVSRASERLILLDVQPTDSLRQMTLTLLDLDDSDEISPVIPEVVAKALAEDGLLPEERVRLCEQDAIQFLSAKPEMAWSRAKQAVSILGVPGKPGSVEDESVITSAFRSLCRVALTLAIRKVKLPAELGSPDLWAEAHMGATLGAAAKLANLVRVIPGAFRPVTGRERLEAVLNAVQALAVAEREAWLMTELAGPGRCWIAELEAAAADMEWSGVVLQVLPHGYEVFGIADGAERIRRFRQAAIVQMVDAGKYDDAIPLLEAHGGDSKLLARCYEGAGRHGDAAELFRKLGQVKDALRNYRSIPDLETALTLAAGVEEYPATESLQWMAGLRELLAKRPENFARVATAAEKKWLQGLLEANLEGPRRAPVKKKRAPRKKTAP